MEFTVHDIIKLLFFLVVECVSDLNCPALSVVQQAAAVRTHSDLQVGEYTDLEETSAWTGQQWSQEIIENQVCLFVCPKVYTGLTLILCLGKFSLG